MERAIEGTDAASPRTCASTPHTLTTILLHAPGFAISSPAMAEPKLTPIQMQRIDQIQGFLKTVDQVKKLVGELEGNRAARPQVLQEMCARIARELSRMRQRANGANIGTIADVAGGLSTLASRSTGLLMKIRQLKEGTASLSFQLDRALTQAQTPIEKPDTG